ncbi:hypothetical protein B566_EDAN009411 [Ephemera danica]|nr:hypothetical protein B566_EDAN009411 [Ephemera danica]
MMHFKQRLISVSAIVIMKSLVLACCLISALILVKAQDDSNFDGPVAQDHGGRYVRSPYHHEGGSSGGGGGGGHDSGHVEYGAHTGEKGAFEWHSHHPVHTDH